MSCTHNRLSETHWTNSHDENLLWLKLDPWGIDKMQTLPAEKKAVQSEGIHSVALERHYSVSEVSALWGISEKTVRRLFDGEDGVLKWGSGETLRKRRYQNLRIPQSVLIRVHHRRRA
jgi:hypothetical protein